MGSELINLEHIIFLAGGIIVGRFLYLLIGILYFTILDLVDRYRWYRRRNEKLPKLDCQIFKTAYKLK